MGDVFQSKDILKLKSHAIKHEGTTSYERDEEKKVISVQGMYVVGVHRVPSYFDPGLFITDISTNEPDIVEYSEVAKQLFSDSTIEICDVNCNSSTIINEVIENTPRFDFGLRITNITTTHPTIST